uniref:Coatomer subunit epsilon n=1 Tax=Plectus sambesii TaxID=2011161 RepID=A0A914VXG5_9BILA
MGKEDANVDVLFEVRNAYYLGNYQQCINEAQKVRVTSDEDKTTKDCFMYRAYIAQNKFTIALDEITGSSKPELQAIRTLADYLSNERRRSQIVAELEKKMNAGTELNDMFFITAALIYMREQNIDTALRMLHQSEDLEARSLTIQCLLKIDRVDLALKEVKKMQESDEDATVTQLALAWVNMGVGKEKLQDAFYIYQEMIDKYGETPLLLVAQAACLIQQHKYEDAEKLLMEALQRDANNAEALANMIVVSQCLGKAPELSNRYINQLKEAHASHPWTRDFVAKEQMFDRLAMESSA